MSIKRRKMEYLTYLKASTTVHVWLHQPTLIAMRRSSVSGADGALPQETTNTAGIDAHGPVPLDIVTPAGGSGVNVSIRDAVLVVNRHEVIFALGKFAVLHNVQTHEFCFIGGQQPAPSHSQFDGKCQQHSADLGEITALALCGKRHYVAICRAATRSSHIHATVSVHSLRATSSQQSTTTSRQQGTRQRTLGFDGTDRFNGAALSSDGKLVCCQCANVSWTIVVWDWSRERQIAVTDVHCKVTRVRFNVVDMAQISTSGGNQLKLWTLSEYTLKTFASFKSGDALRARHKVASYTDHIWLPDDCLVALLENGGVQLIINGELIQTVQAFADGITAYSITSQNNGEAGILVGGASGSLASLRVVSKLMRSGEKELHLQRRMTVANAEGVRTMGVDATGSVLVCCTEQFYGSYDLSSLCLLLNENESLTLTTLASTPFVSEILRGSLKASTRRPCFGVLAKLPGDTDAVLVWNQSDASECIVSHTFDPHSAPASIDFHPGGTEMAVSFQQKVVIYFVLHDSLKVAFELPAKHVSHIAYSPSGSYLVIGRSSSRSILIYRTTNYKQREPEVIAIYQGVEESIQQLVWSPNDTSFYYTDGCTGRVELRHCYMFAEGSSGEADEVVSLKSRTDTLASGRTFVGLASSKYEHDNHGHALFAVEKEGTLSSSAHDSVSYLRGWLNGRLVRDALVTGQDTLGLKLHHDVTAITAGSGRTVLLGTSRGLILMLYWKLGQLNGDGTQKFVVMTMHSQVDLHPAPIVGMLYSHSNRLLVTCDPTGVLLASTIRRAGQGDDGLERQIRQSASHGASDAFDDGCVFSEPSHTFLSVCQPDEIALFDRNFVELRRLKQLDLEGELQQVKMENELLTKQLSEQKQKLKDEISNELQRHHKQADTRHQAMVNDWEQRLAQSLRQRERSVGALQGDAQLARDQYLASADRMNAECEQLKCDLLTAKQTLEDLRLSGEEREAQVRQEFVTRLEEERRVWLEERTRLTCELDGTKKNLREVLEQHNQDHFTQLAMLSTAVDREKSRATSQMSHIQGKMAALHQEVKMLLAALTQKDHDVQNLHARHAQDQEEISMLKDQARRERDHVQQLIREKQDLLAAANEQRLVRENLERLNDVHRSQIELLQKNLLPKQRELDQMQQHLNQLHQVNQEIVVQANVSDRLRNESSTRARQSEADVVDTQSLLEHVRHSIVVLQDELGELVKQSVVQEKSAIIREIMRIHKRITRQMDALQAKDGREEEVSAELHRQNKFLMKNKQHLRKQVEISYTEKHKLVSALSFQNSTLMNELNTVRRQNKELERVVKQLEYKAESAQAQEEERIAEEKRVSPTEEFDSRETMLAFAPRPTSHRPTSAVVRTREPVIIPDAKVVRSGSSRPKSAINRLTRR